MCDELRREAEEVSEEHGGHGASHALLENEEVEFIGALLSLRVKREAS